MRVIITGHLMHCSTEQHVLLHMLASVHLSSPPLDKVYIFLSLVLMLTEQIISRERINYTLNTDNKMASFTVAQTPPQHCCSFFGHFSYKCNDTLSSYTS